jgi:signal transduction histidine kinase
VPYTRELVRLLQDIATEPDCDLALERISQGALEFTRSRHAMIAVLNQAQGFMELRYGAGEGFAEARNEVLGINVGREEGIVGYVAATGAVVATGNVREQQHYRSLFPSTESELAVPVTDRHRRVVAVLNVESDRSDAYGEEAQEVLMALAYLSSMVLEQKEHSSREEALMEIGSALDTALTEEALIDRVIQVAAEKLRFQACSIFLLDRRSDTFVLRGSYGRMRDKVGKIAYARGEGFTGWVAESGHPILLDNPQADPRWRGKYIEFPSEQIASFLAVPIPTRSGPIGAIRVLRRKSENPFLDNRFTEDDLRLMHAIAEQVGTGLENVRNLERIIRSERMIAWGELSAKSSHMIGNRVFALKGDINELAHLLAERELDVKELRELQKSLSTNVQRIEEILQDFRDFVTATQIVREPHDLNALVHETVEEVFPRRSEVSLQLELDGDLPPVPVDAKRLRRAISELIENSMNYMEQGRLRVATRQVSREAHERTRTSKIEQFAQVEIEDTGPGVDPQQKNQIFQPFFSGRVKGMGLGLSIVKGIVDAHGGEVFEAGEAGAGAKFVILLPLTD